MGTMTPRYLRRGMGFARMSRSEGSGWGDRSVRPRDHTIARLGGENVSVRKGTDCRQGRQFTAGIGHEAATLEAGGINLGVSAVI